LSVIIEGIRKSGASRTEMSYVLYRNRHDHCIMVFVVLASIYYPFLSSTAIMLIALAL